MPFYAYLEKLQQIEETYKRHKVKEADALRKTLLDNIAKDLGEKGVKALSFILHNIDRERGIAVPDDLVGLSALLENHPKTTFELQYEKWIDPDRRKVYESLLPYAVLAHLLEPNGEPTEHALKLAVLFGDKQKALKYIAKYAEVNKKRRDDRDFYLMDAALMISFPPPEHYNVALWCKIAITGDNLFDLSFRGRVLPHAADIEQAINKDVSHYLYRQEQKLDAMLSEFAENVAEKQKEMESIQLGAKPLAAEEEGTLKKLKREMLFIQGLQKKAEAYKKDFFEKMQAMQKINSKEGERTPEDVQTVNNYKQDLLKLCEKLNDEIYSKGATDENTVRQRELLEINKKLSTKEKEQEKIRIAIEKNVKEIGRLKEIAPINSEAIAKLEKEVEALKTKGRSVEEEIEKIMKSKIANLPALPMLLENEERLAILSKLAKEVEDVRYTRIASRNELTKEQIDVIKSLSEKNADLQREILSQLQGSMKIDQIKSWLKAKVKIWKVLDENHSQLSDDEDEIYTLLSNEVSKLKVALADAYAENGVPLEEADLDMVNAYEERYKKEGSPAYTYFIEHGLSARNYEKFQKLDRTKGGILMPDITIDGATLGYAGFYLKKVNVQNDLEAARAACIGKLTGCCQSLSGEAGESCTIHGLTDPRGGFYMLCKGDVNNPKVTDEMWGATWAWRSKQNNIVFDSIEMHPDFRDRDIGIEDTKGRDLAKGMFNELARQIVSDPKHDVEAAYCGTRSGISEEFGGIEADNNQLFAKYIGYSDAREQNMISHREAPYLLFQKIPGKEGAALLYQQLKGFLMRCLKSTDSGKFSELINVESFSKMQEYIVLNKRKDIFIAVDQIMGRIAPEIQGKFADLEFIIGANSQVLLEKIQEDTANQALYQKIYGIIKNQELRKEWMTLLLSNEPENDLMLAIINDPVFDVNFKMKGYTPLMELFVNRKASLELIEAFLKRKDLDLDASILLFSRWNAEEFKLILSKCTPACVQAPGVFGRTALMEVIGVISDPLFGEQHTCLEDNALQMLIKKSNINHADDTGKTALMYAIENKNCHHILLLLKAGARTDLADKSGKTAMDYANGNPILLGLLKTSLESIPENVSDLDDDLLEKALNLSDMDIIRSVIHSGSYVQSKTDGEVLREKISMEESIQKKALYQRLLKLVWTPRDDLLELRDALNKSIEGSIEDKEIIALINNPKLEVNNQDVFVASEGLCSPLIYMLSSNIKSNIIKAFLQRDDVDVNKFDVGKKPPLTLALRSQPVEIVNLLLAKADDSTINWIDPQRRTHLMLAVQYGVDQLTFEKLIKKININSIDYDGKTALMYAAEMGNAEFVKALIKASADLYAVDYFGKSAKDYAQNDLIRALIIEARVNQLGAEPERERQEEVEPEKEQQEQKQAVADELESDFQSQISPAKFSMAVMKSTLGLINEDEVIALIKNPALNVNATQIFANKDDVPLTFMLRQKASPNILKALLQREDLNVNVIDPVLGVSALIEALERSQEPEIINMILRKCDADTINATFDKSKTPLMLVAEQGNTEFVKALIKAGADVSAVDNMGKSAEDYAEGIALKALIREARLGKPEVEPAEVQPEPVAPQDAKQAAADEMIFSSRSATPPAAAELKSEVFEGGNTWEDLFYDIEGAF